MSTHAAELLALLGLDRVPWLGNLGRPTERDAEVHRIREWRQWPGPYEPQTDRLYAAFQASYASLLNRTGLDGGQAKALFEGLQEAVFEQAKRALPCEYKEDPWHGPSKAAWDVSCWAALYALAGRLGAGLTPEAEAAWSWVEAGHWPCGYTDGGRLMVF